MAQVKTKDEIRKIKMACRITDAIFINLCKIKNLSEFSEIELRDYILKEIKKKGLRPSFPPIVSGSPRSGNDIHPKPTKEKLKGFVIVDFGVRYEGYCSDMTRMLFIGKPTKNQKEIYKKILDSQLLGIKNSVSGTTCAFIDDKVRKSLGSYKKYFIHTLGHGVGKRIHEPPMLFYKLLKPILKENMVITIEPGIYIKNKFGIRIEDTILITKKDPVLLTKSSKKLMIF